MKNSKRGTFFIIILILLFSIPVIAQGNIEQPKLILWAWERNEKLDFINPKNIGVAFLAKTIYIKGDTFFSKPRLPFLRVPQETWLSAVVRIQITKRKQGPLLHLVNRVAEEITNLKDLKGVSALQIDFDARSSERPFYRALLAEVRKRVGDSYPLSITALGSWCTYDDWISGLPVDEAVPMFFRMGPERPLFMELLQKEAITSLCKNSIGISLDEPTNYVPKCKHLYVFSPKAWTENEVNKLLMETKR